MDTATTEEKFHSAVELIRNLPKSGKIQPSNELKLKFYSYFKQATEGPCELPRPSFWDVVNRAKWDAWNKLGNMSKEEAMTSYVKEFVKILEDTPLDEEDPTQLKNYVDLLGPYISYVPKDIQEKHILVNGKANKMPEDQEEVMERCKSSTSEKVLKSFRNDYAHGLSEDIYSSAVNGHNLNGNNESDSDEFSDTLERVDESETEESPDNLAGRNLCASPVSSIKGSNIVNVRGGGDQRVGTSDGSSPAAGPSGNRGNRSSRQTRNSDNSLQYASNNNNISGAGGNRRSGGNLPVDLTSDVNEQLALAVIRLQHIMEQVVVRLDSLEALLTQRQASNPALKVSTKKSVWSFLGISPKAAVIILAWPFIVQWIMYLIRKRNRRL